MPAPRTQSLAAAVALAALAACNLGPFQASLSTVMTPMSPAARAELAPGGRLRAALNLSNMLLVTTGDAEPKGVAPDLARELARRAGATVELVGYVNAGLAADAVSTGTWDVAFIGAEPARAAEITFSPAYVEIESTYVVPAGSPITRIDDVDRTGVRIVSTSRAAYTLYLQRTLRAATLVETEGIQGSVDLFAKGGFDALAGLRPRLLEALPELPGARVLDGRFTAVQQAIGVPRERTAAAEYLEAFVDEIRTSGLLAEAVARHSAHGLSIVPARSNGR